MALLVVMYNGNKKNVFHHRYFIGTTMIVRAVRTIGAGEEISENYGPIFTITPENERKRRMRVQYWFDCNCEACSGHWPLLEDLDPTILRYLSIKNKSNFHLNNLK